MVEHEENLIFDLLSQLLAFGLHDDILAATIEDAADIYTKPIPAHRNGIQLKTKREKLDVPIFRDPEQKGHQTSSTRPLK